MISHYDHRTISAIGYEKKILALNFKISSKNLRNIKLHTKDNAWMSTNGISGYRANCLDNNRRKKISRTDNSMIATQKNIKDAMLSHPFFWSS